MTEEQINVAIAEACGWKPDNRGLGWLSPHGCYAPLPNYCFDLNAMHEAEKVFLARFEDKPEFSELWSNYQTNLMIAGVAYRSYHATARQRAEALLRTLGRWKEVQK